MYQISLSGGDKNGGGKLPAVVPSSVAYGPEVAEVL